MGGTRDAPCRTLGDIATRGKKTFCGKSKPFSFSLKTTTNTKLSLYKNPNDQRRNPNDRNTNPTRKFRNTNDKCRNQNDTRRAQINLQLTCNIVYFVDVSHPICKSEPFSQMIRRS